MDLNQYASGGCFKQLWDAAGGEGNYYQYAPGGPPEQLRVLIDPEMVWDQHALGGCAGQAVIEIEEGGSGAPEWVPANAKIHIDLVGGDSQGRAWVGGTGEVAVDTLLGTDPASGEAWADTEYDPANLTVDGYVCSPTASLALIGAAETAILDAATFVFRLKQVLDVVPGALDNPEFRLVSDDGGDGVAYKLRPNFATAVVSSDNGSLFNEIESITTTGLGAINVTAGTLTATRADQAVNGSAAFAGVMDETDRPSGNPFTIVIIGTGISQQYAVQSITIYDPLSDTTGLSELSEP